MALRAAVANGNWSSPSTWNGGILPAAGDIVASNGFTVTIDQNVNIDSITNSATNPISIIPVMTSATTPSGVVVVSSQEPSIYLGWKAFDNNTAQSNSWSNNRSYTGFETLEYQFPTPKTVVAYMVQTVASPFPTAWQFQAWDGSAWIVLDSVTGATSTSIRTFSNTTAYSRYRIAVSAPTTGFYLGELRMFDVAADAIIATAGGGFILNSGVTVTCTGANGIYGSTATTVTYSGSGTSTINSAINSSSTTNINTIVHSGLGSLIINGNVSGGLTTTTGITINFTGAGTLTINGNIYGYNSNAAIGTINVSSTGTLNIVGNVDVQGTQKNTIVLASGSTLNLTGDVSVRNAGLNSLVGIAATSATINITGNLYITGATNSANVGWGCLSASNSTINITGNLTADTSATAHTSGSYPLSVSGTSYLNHIGTITGGRNLPAYNNTSSTSINILSGPFVSGTTGTQPFYVTRMHYRRTMGSYFEFRDNSTNGALPPAASAPATRLVSPNTVVDSPLPANVRYGTVYASGSLTGTMRVPVPGAVTYGVEVDNTVGTALLSAAQVWNYLRNDISVSGSIGDRLKNCATVESTGSQIASFKSS